MGCRFQKQISTKNDPKMVISGGSLGPPQGTQMVPKISFPAITSPTPAPLGPKRSPEDPGRAPRGPQEATRGRPEASKFHRKWTKEVYKRVRNPTHLCVKVFLQNIEKLRSQLVAQEIREVQNKLKKVFQVGIPASARLSPCCILIG